MDKERIGKILLKILFVIVVLLIIFFLVSDITGLTPRIYEWLGRRPFIHGTGTGYHPGVTPGNIMG